ncbi:acetolactate synthase [Pueribacillus theae]|uniref:Acetolactate synthase n=1 Tax=Pueribacillus theae TaxID=2171751 RepID=A0A2U1JZU0_9BACI|nr:thiamine pyrophosphate-binding protein [Pueribacillus theae]PWA10652.1 acetolactate synthase [Pueribacillus theae]
MKAVRAVIDYLKLGGVQYIFGIPAGSVNAFFDELYDVNEMTPIVTKHEGAASYMAASYAKYTNGLSVCIGSSGPGGTNFITGAANAMREHLPILFLTGGVPVGTRGLNASQELDVEPVYRPVTKYSVTVSNAHELLEEVAKATEIALSGVPGPVHVAMPIDVQLTEMEPVPIPPFPIRRPVEPDKDTIRKVAVEIANKESGCLFVGQGIRGSAQQVIELAELLDWPIVKTPQAKGLIKDDHPLLLGVFGFAGNENASAFINDNKADAILLIGTSLGETATSNYNQNIVKDRYAVQFDFDETVFHRKYEVDEPILGDISISLSWLIEELKLLGFTRKSYGKKQGIANASRNEYNTQNVLLELQDALPSSTRYTVDIGEFMSYVIHYMDVVESDTFDINVHFGAMGSGIGSAIGAKLAEPNRPVVSITGDGCFFMHGMEVLTAKEYGLPILFVVMNNSRLGMVYHGHSLQYNRTHSRFEQQPINLSAMAEAMDIPSVRIEKMEDFHEYPVINLLNNLHGPAILEIDLVDNNVPPMGDRVKFLSSFGK